MGEISHDDKLFDPGQFALRLRDLIYPEKLAVFSDRAGISLSVLNKYLAAPENLSPSVEVVVRICKATRSSMDWLISGVGETPDQNDGLVFIPIYDVKLAAGQGSFVSRERRIGDMPFDKALLTSLGFVDGKGLGVLTAEGDSMEPMISDGARVLIDFNDKRLREDVYAFRLGDSLRIKRLRPIGLAGIEAISANPVYAPEHFEGDILNHFEVIGRALWAGTIL